MKPHILIAMSVLVVLSAACEQAIPDGQLETLVAATISAGQTGTAAVEQAVEEILTASAPPPTSTHTPTQTVVPPTLTNTPAPTETSTEYSTNRDH